MGGVDCHLRVSLAIATFGRLFPRKSQPFNNNNMQGRREQQHPGSRLDKRACFVKKRKKKKKKTTTACREKDMKPAV